MTDQTYNGWTNYETWCWKLWQDNDQGSYNYWRDVTAECAESNTPRADLADRMAEETEDQMPELDGVFGDLLKSAVGSINWYEIAENMLEEYEEETAT